MAALGRRLRTLYGLGKKRGRLHRYTLVRWLIGIVFTIGVAAIPLLGILRIDLWGGRHRWLGEGIGLLEAARAFAFPFLAINILIILASRFLGRWLCGFVCPVGNLNRLSEWLRWNARKRASWPGAIVLFGVSLLLAAITFSYWVDWRVFVEGSGQARLFASLFLASMAGAMFLSTRLLGMRFCRDLCPSGVYFALLGPSSMTGIEFAHPESCTDCHACEAACPVDLSPREMAEEKIRPGMGLYPDGLTNLANCLRCGDCVVVCEDTTDSNQGDTPLRMGFLASSGMRRPNEAEQR